jgi:hypothetical protein
MVKGEDSACSIFTIKYLTPREKVLLTWFMVICIFLFNGDYITHDDRMIGESEGDVVAYSRQYPDIYLEGPE